VQVEKEVRVQVGNIKEKIKKKDIKIKMIMHDFFTGELIWN